MKSTIPSTDKKLSYTLAQWDVPMRGWEIRQLRDEICRIGGGGDDLLHNHQLDSGRLQYRYPLVQYKIIDGKAALLGLGAGAESVAKIAQKQSVIILNGEPWRLQEPWLDSRDIDLHLHTAPEPTAKKMPCTYRLNNWMALNAHNYQAWQAQSSLLARLALLESTLAAHLLKFCSGIHWLLPPKALEVELLECRALTPQRAFDNRFSAFSVLFRSNLELPPYTGIGKSSSHGFGTCSTPGQGTSQGAPTATLTTDSQLFF